MARLWAACATHHRVPVAVLERFPRGERIPHALQGLHDLPSVRGALVLSTCNRYEVYLVADDDLTRPALLDALARTSDVAPGLLEEYVDVQCGDEAVRHLFSVAAGLESRVLGEAEVLGQLRAAAQTAAREGTLDDELADLVQWAVRAGRRTRRAGGSPHEHASVGDEGVRLVARRLGRLVDRSVAVIGAGRVAAQVADAVSRAGGGVVVVARDPARAAERLPGRPVAALPQLPEILAEVDAVVCATSAPTALVTGALLESVMARRPDRTLVVVDLAVPRNVEPLGTTLQGLTVLDLDALPGRAEQTSGLDTAHETVAAETAAYLASRAVRRAGSLLADVTDRAELVRRDELARVRGRVSEAEQTVLEEVTRRLVGKLLHPALVGIRELAAAGELEAVRHTASLLGAGDLDERRIAG